MILRILRRIFARKAKADLKIFTDNIDNKALEQVKELMSQPAFANAKVRIMPDVHAGIGCVIGFTGDLGKKVIPNIVGSILAVGWSALSLGKWIWILSGWTKSSASTLPLGKTYAGRKRCGFAWRI